MKKNFISVVLMGALLLASVVTAQAAAPVATSFATAVAAGSQTVIQLQGADSDGTPLTFAVAGSPTHGALSNLNASTGAIVYTPTAGYTGSDSFTFTVTSGGDTTAAATVSLTVTNAKTRIVDTLTNPDSSPRQGKVSFFLTQVASSPSGIIPAKASVSAQLNAQGQFDLSVYPSSSVSPVQYYQVWFDDAITRNTQLLGIYEVPASTTTVTLAGHKIINANLEAQYTFASKAEVDALKQAVAAATAAQLYPSLASGKHVLWNGITFANSLVSESGSTVTINGNLTVSGTITGPLVTTLDNLSDVTAAGASEGQFLRRGASEWSAAALSAADIPALDATKISSGQFSNARTTATSGNTAGTIVARDESGNFNAGIITAGAFIGNGAGLTGIGSGTGGVINTGSTTVGADSDANAVGVIDEQIANTTYRRLNNDGTTSLIGGLEAYAQSGLPLPCAPGRLAVLTDGRRGLVRCSNSGTSWEGTGRASVLDLGATGDGTADDRTALSNLATALATTGGTIYFPSGTGASRDYLVNSNLTLPANVRLEFERGARLKIPTGVTVTLTDGEALTQVPRQQIFNTAGTGKVVCTKPPAAYLPEWWGAVADGSTNSRTAIQAALQAIHDSGSGRLSLGYGSYKLTGALDSTRHAALYLPDNISSSEMVNYVIEGQCLGAGSDDNPMTTKCTTIDGSALTGSTTDAAILAGSVYSSSPTHNYVSVLVRNLVFRTTANPTVGGIQLHNVKAARIDGVGIDNGQTYVSTTIPTNIRTALSLPTLHNYSDVEVHNFYEWGYYVGMVPAEHTRFLGRVSLNKSAVGVLIEPGFHVLEGALTFSETLTQLENQGTATVRLLFDVERWDTVCASGCSYTSSAYAALSPTAVAPTPSGTSAAGYQSVPGLDINDPLNTLHGRIDYKLTIANQGNTQLPLSITGAGHVQFTNLFMPVIRALVYQANPQSIPDSAATVIALDTETEDTVGGGDNTIYELHRTDTNSGRFTFGRAGVVTITANLAFNSNSTGFRSISFFLNNTTLLGANQVPAVSGDSTNVSLTQAVKVAAGDYIVIKGYQNAGSTVTLASASASVRLDPAQ